MKKIITFNILILLIYGLSGCTQVVTAPIKVTGAVVSSTIDIAGSATHAVVGNKTSNSLHF